MAKANGKTDRLLMVAAIAGFAASRLLTVPRPLLIALGALAGVAILWLCIRALIRRRREKRKDRATAWARFIRDRNIS